MKTKFNVYKMTCSACQGHVNSAFCNLNGVSEVNVNLLSNSMTVIYDENVTNTDEIIKSVIKAGYDASVYKAEVNNYKLQNKIMKYRLIISFIFLVPLMYVSMGHMTNLVMPKIFHNGIWFSLIQIILLIPILLVNYNYFVVGFKRTFILKPNMDSLIAISTSAAIIYGVINTIRIITNIGNNDLVNTYKMDLYFESAGTIITLVTFGKYLESKSKRKTSEAINKLIDLTPKTAIVLRNNIEMLVNIEDVKIGDLIKIKPGFIIPVDGIIIEGSSSIDEQVITGESIPVYKTVDDKVISATVNKTGSFIFKATSTSENSTINQIITLVEEASNSKAPIAALADKISLYFVPIVIGISLITFFIWYFTKHTFEFSFSMAISVLVISCPCALGLATPVAIMVGTGKAAENGILIKSAESLQNAHNIDTIVLDKTGTITIGKPVVTDILPILITEEKLLEIAYSLESYSEHPLAYSVVSYAKEKNIKLLNVFDFNSSGGKGINGIINSKKYISGNKKYLDEENIDLSKYNYIIDNYSNEGKTVLLFADEKSLIGIIAVSDIIKENSVYAIKKFKEYGLEVIMLTGDNKQTALAIQKVVNTNQVIAEVLPTEKQEVIKRLQNEDKNVAMIGDGVNDSIALMTANVGIAIGAGSDIAIESADIILIKNDLLDAFDAIRLSKTVFNNVKMNLFWAFFYNIVGIPLAAGALYPLFGLKLNPMFAAFAMSMSSVCVVLNALRIKKFQNTKILGGNSMEKIIKVDGMTCNHCVGRVKEVLLNLPNVKGVDVDLKKKKVTILLEKEISDEIIYKTIKDAGYEASEYVEKKRFIFGK